MESEATHDGALLASNRHRQFEEILMRLPHGVVVVDRALTIEFLNPAAIGMLKNGRAGEALTDSWPDFSLRAFAENLFTADSAAGGDLVVIESRTLCVQGLPAAHAETAVVLIEDVTEREHQRRSERRFIENAAHELRTPLAAIVSVIEVLESGAKDEPALRDRFLKHLRAHSDRLTRLATSLLVLARIQTGHQQPQLELVPVRPLLEEIAGELPRRPGVEIVVRADDDLATLADRELLHRIITNIAVNANKHTPHGKIVFEARELGESTELVIRDSGLGMSTVDRERAFEPFHRAADSEGEGFGLGLAIAAEAVEALGGTVALDSNPDGGTTARVELPRARMVHR
jgi:signal transduction histidine kinase